MQIKSFKSVEMIRGHTNPGYVGILNALKRMHYDLLVVEACAVELATRHS